MSPHCRSRSSAPGEGRCINRPASHCAGSAASAARRRFSSACGTLALFLVYGNVWLADPAQLVERGVLFVWLLTAIACCIFGVVRHADALAELLGEPLGTLILTISVIVIEVSLIAAVMLEGATDPTLARDTMFAVIMIMMNGMVGLCLLSGGLRHVQQEYNLEGARAYLAVLIPLSAIALILPNRTVSTALEGTLNFWQAMLFSVATLVLYAIFLGTADDAPPRLLPGARQR